MRGLNKIFKKNQVIIIVISLMLITAGYLNFTNNQNANNLLETSALADSEKMAEIGDAQLVSALPSNTNSIETKAETPEVDIKKADKEVKADDNTNEKSGEKKLEGEVKAEAVQTNAKTDGNEYFTTSRLERDTMYSQMIESYQKMLDKNNISEKQKNTAQKEIKRINEEKNALMITENLIKTKGFEDLIIFINNDSINVIIKDKKLEKNEIAQIQNIVTRELKAKIENIHISNKE